MEALIKVTLVLHVMAGISALVAGFIAISAKKGFRLHRMAGLVFYASIMAVAATGFYVALVRSNIFLVYISVFVFYQCYSGYRAIRNKSLRPSAADWVVWTLAAVNSFLMVYSMNIILMVFGGISSFLVITDLRIFITVLRGQELPRLQWLARHIGMMLGTYIATFTAFLVVNVPDFAPQWLPWLLPTMIGVPLIFYFIRRYTNRGRRVQTTGTVLTFLLLGAVFLPGTSNAQPYVEGGNTRHRFAQLTLGTDVRFFPKGGSITYPDGGSSSGPKALDAFGESRLVFGGTHFWGHADFYVAIPVLNIGNSGSSTSVEMGARVFPWRIEDGKLRPYIGTAWMVMLFRQNDGPELVRHTIPATAGLVYNSGPHLFEIGTGYNLAKARAYYTSIDEVAQVRLQPLWFSAGYRFMMDNTLSAERDWQSGRTQYLTDTLAKLGRLNGLTVAIGASSATFLRNSSHNMTTMPFIGRHSFANVFADIGLGYYLHRSDIQLNLAFRSIRSSISAYSYTQQLKRTAFTAEAFRFLTDYHGFALFAGPAISYERLRVGESYPDGETAAGSSNLLRPGLTFGWDIRPNRLQSWYLRTNLRWFPNLSIEMDSGSDVRFDQLEFNFIQLVVFPGRMRW